MGCEQAGCVVGMAMARPWFGEVHWAHHVLVGRYGAPKGLVTKPTS